MNCSLDEFKTLKKAAQEKIIKSILYKYRYKKRCLDYEDEILVKHILKNHPDHDEKLSNYYGIVVRKSIESKRYNKKASYCFHIIKTDGRLVDFSIKACFDEKGTNYNRTEYLEEMDLVFSDSLIKALKDKNLKLPPNPFRLVESEKLQYELRCGMGYHIQKPAVYFLSKGQNIYYVGQSLILGKRIYDDDHIQIHKGSYCSWIDATNRKECLDLERKYMECLIPEYILENNCSVAKMFRRNLGKVVV